MRKRWTAEDRAELTRLYPYTPSKELADRFNRSLRAIYSMASELKLNKSPDYLASEKSTRIKNKQRLSISTEFNTGHTPHNKGVKGWQAGGKAEQTQFKPRRKPHNYQPIGTELVDDYGYLRRKIANTGKRYTNWVFIHKLIWKEHHGPIPKGHIVAFRNGDKSDIRLDNLELISRAENLKRNTLHRLPEPLVQVIRIKSAITRRINQRTKQETDHEKQD